MSTCQICGRTIKANTGLIAHHGYKRPSGGWQTDSCMGAKYRPYEQACDRISAAIASIERHILDLQETLALFKSDPPAELSFQRGGFGNKVEKVQKPDDFDPITVSGANRPFTYACEYAGRRTALVSNIRDSKITLRYMQDRLAAWVAPTE